MSGELLTDANSLKTIVMQQKTCRIMSEIYGKKRDFYYNVPLIFPEGKNWDDLHAERIQVDKVEVLVKPYKGTTVQGISEPGKISGEFPVYMHLYAGNTAAENYGTITFSKLTASVGTIVGGDSTSGVRVDYSGKTFKTLLEPGSLESSELKIQDKQPIEEGTSFDSWLLNKETAILQKGRVIVYIPYENFMIEEKELYLTEPNGPEDKPSGDGDKPSGDDDVNPDGNGMAKALLLRHLRSKSKKEPVAVQEPKRKQRKAVQGTMEYLYIEDPIELEDKDGKKVKSLVLDYGFYILQRYHIHYSKSA